MKNNLWDRIRKTLLLVPDSEIKNGLVIKMAPGYHTRKPYYVEVLFFYPEAKEGQLKMITGIPGQHRLSMVVGSNWEYHHKRMEIIGMKSEFGHLLHNQSLI